jgi:hypothetical protein
LTTYLVINCSLSSSLVETPLQMQMEQRQQQRRTGQSAPSNTTATASAPPTPIRESRPSGSTAAAAVATSSAPTARQPTVLVAQSETRGTDGRRRISPSLLSNTPLPAAAATPSTNTLAGVATTNGNVANTLEARTIKRPRINNVDGATLHHNGIGASAG